MNDMGAHDAALEEADERLLDAAAFGVALFDAEDLGLLYANAAALAAFRLESVELGRATLFTLAPHQAPAIAEALSTLLAAPRAAPPLELRPTPPGRVFAVEPVLAGRLRRVRRYGRRALMFSFTDQGPERRAIARLRLDAELRAGALARVDVAASVIDASGRLIDLDPDARRLLGLTARERAPLLVDQLAAPDDHHLRAFLASGALTAAKRFDVGAEVRLRRASGSPAVARLAVGPVSRAGDGRRAIALAVVAAPAGVGAPPLLPSPADDGPAPDRALRAGLQHALRDHLNSVAGFLELAERRGGAGPTELARLRSAVSAAAALAGGGADESEG